MKKEKSEELIIRRVELANKLKFVTNKYETAIDTVKNDKAIQGDKYAAQQDSQSNLHFIKSQLDRHKILEILNQLKSQNLSKLIGVISHFVYWSVFDGFNEMSLDHFHEKSLLITLLQQLDLVEKGIV